MSKDRQDLARYLLQHSADDAAHEPLSQEAQSWARVRVLEAELAQVKEERTIAILTAEYFYCSPQGHAIRAIREWQGLDDVIFSASRNGKLRYSLKASQAKKVHQWFMKIEGGGE